jgi:hypothetical protein
MRTQCRHGRGGLKQRDVVMDSIFGVVCKDEEREREREREREKEEERHHRLYAASDQQLKITLLVLCQINQGDQPPSVQSANKIKLWIPQRNIKNWCD